MRILDKSGRLQSRAFHEAVAPTTVIHIRDSGKSPNERYVGRPGKKQAGEFGNPIKCNASCAICGALHATKGSTLGCYEVYLRARLESDGGFYEAFWKLRGRTLVCFCCPKTGFDPEADPICHGQIMAQILNSENPLTVTPYFDRPNPTNRNPLWQGDPDATDLT